MNLFQLVFKQMRQRSLSTWLTLLSVVLGVALAIAIMILRRESAALFGQSDYGYDVLIGPKGSPLQLTLNTVYHIDRSPGVIPYAVYERLNRQYRSAVRIAVPFAVGDTYKNLRIVGTLPKLFGIAEDGSEIPPERAFEYRLGKRFAIAQGKVFHPEKFEAVIGSDVTKLTGLKLGDTFKATHGAPQPGQTPDEHDTLWTVVGVLAPTKTANDRVLFIPLTSFYAIAEHEEALGAIAKVRGAQTPAPVPVPRPEPKPLAPTTKHDDHDHDHDGKQDHAAHEHDAAVATRPTTGAAHDDHEEHGHHEHFELNPDGTIHLDLPKDEWQVSAILVRSRGAFPASQLMYQINNGQEAMAVNPASVMREFFRNFLEPTSKVWLLVALLVTVVAAVSILVSIYNSVSARLREIAILRALGATRARILAVICLEAGLIGVLGGILGLILGHLLGAIGSAYMQRIMGEGINWVAVGGEETLYLGAVVVIAVLAGLVPALKAYRTPVATNLVSG